MKFFPALVVCSLALRTVAAPSVKSAVATPAPVARAWTPAFATYLGGSGLDAASAIALDGAGNFYVAGVSSSPGFPGADSPDTKRADAFLCKFSPGFQLLWTRFIGGSGFDQARGVALDKTGNVYLVGDCENGDFPLLNAPPLPHGKSSAFVACFSAEGTLRMATQLGGDGWTRGQAIVLDGQGNLWLAGTMRGQTFPSQAVRLPGAGQNDVWVSKLAPSGELLSSTILGGKADEDLGNLVLAPGGGVALAGTTASTDFPVVKAIQAAFGGAGSDGDVKGDAWVAILDAQGKTRTSTFFGGRSSDVGGAVAFAPNGDLWLTGSSASRDLPLKNLLPGGDQPGGTFLARFKGDGSQLLQCTFVPGAPRRGRLLNVEPNGDFWLGSDGGSYSDLYQLTHLNGAATKVLETISWPEDHTEDIARGADGALYLTGSATAHLPTRRALMANPGGGQDAFVAVLKQAPAPAAPDAQPVTTISVDAPAKGLAASGATNAGDDGEVQVALYRSADSKYWTGTGWSNRPTWLSAGVSGGRWTLKGLPQGANLPPGDYFLHAVAISSAALDSFPGAEYSGEGSAKSSRKIVVAP